MSVDDFVRLVRELKELGAIHVAAEGYEAHLGAVPTEFDLGSILGPEQLTEDEAKAQWAKEQYLSSGG